MGWDGMAETDADEGGIELESNVIVDDLIQPPPFPS